MSIYLNYYSFNVERADDGWKTFSGDITALKNYYNDSHIVLNERQKQIKEILYNNIDYFIDKAESEPGELYQPFETLDIYYGGISDKGFEDGKMAVTIMKEILVPEFDLKCNKNFFPLGNELVRFYEDLNRDKMLKFAVTISDYFEEDEENGMLYAVDFLEKLKPVIKDLKDNSKSIFFESLDGDIYDYQNIVNDLLKSRIGDHIKLFKKTFIV
jgi:hypothetical protein